MASSRRAHHMLIKGLPSVREEGATSPYISTSVNQTQAQRGGRHLFEPKAATSRGRHLSKRGAPPKAHKLKSNKIYHQSNPNHMDIVPFDPLIDFVIKSSPNLSPFILFLF